MDWGRLILPVLRNTFPQDVTWLEAPNGQPLVITGRLRIDGYTVNLGGDGDGLNVTETWWRCDRCDVFAADVPQIGHRFIMRDEGWEIVHLDRDDIGELAYRLIKHGEDAPLPTEPEKEEDEGLLWKRGQPGRPTLRDDILRAYEAIAPKLPPNASLASIIPLIRRRLTGSSAESPGLSDKTIRNILVGRARVVRRGSE
ncbi:MAG: hypothetical protein FWD12_04400 [Alphaproteobacteria bacterium]|nr:hypothetical protein [Alphaproteobacteria bacterium]